MAGRRILDMGDMAVNAWWQTPLLCTEVTTWRDVIVDTGLPLTPGTWKFPESAGGCCYGDGVSIGNRVMHWMVCQGCVWLRERGLDAELDGSAVRLCFRGLNPLPEGVTLARVPGGTAEDCEMALLVVTTGGVLRFTLPAPALSQHGALSSDIPLTSILCGLCPPYPHDPSATFPIPPPPRPIPGAPLPSLPSTAWLSLGRQARFAVATTGGTILLVTLPAPGKKDEPRQVELCSSSAVQRFLTGWVPNVRGKAVDSPLPGSTAALSSHCSSSCELLLSLSYDLKLRVWNVETESCISELSLLPLFPSPLLSLPPSPRFWLRISPGPSSALCLVVHLPWPQSSFCMMHLKEKATKLVHVLNISTRQSDLRDIALTPDGIWALWNVEDGGTKVAYAAYPSEEDEVTWQGVVMLPFPSDQIHVPPHLDARESYMDYIFEPGRFCRQALNQALLIFRRGKEREKAGIAAWTYSLLRRNIITAVEGEKGVDTANSWARFLAYAAQYQHSAAKPLSLIVCPQSGLSLLLSAGGLSFLVPAHPIDRLALSPAGSLSNTMQFSVDTVFLLAKAREISEQLWREDGNGGESHGEWMERDIEICSPLELEEVAREVALLIRDKCPDMVQQLSVIPELPTVVRPLLEALHPSSPDGSNAGRDVCTLYAGNLPTSAIAAVTVRAARLRLHISFSLLAILNAALNTDRHHRLLLALIKSTLHLCQAYRLLYQTARSLVTLPTMSFASIEVTMRHLSVLDSRPLATHLAAPVSVAEGLLLALGPTSLLQASEAAGSTNWPQILAQMCQSLMYLLWPENPSFSLGEFMLRQHQLPQLQEFCLELLSWSTQNRNVCTLALGQAYLFTGEAEKALSCFLKAAQAGANEWDLQLRLLPPDSSPSPPDTLEMNYYRKVIQQLEACSLPELIISVAKVALEKSSPDDGNVVMFQSRLFLQLLELARYHEAQQLLGQMKDPQGQKSCLRKLVTCLLDNSHFDLLTTLPFGDLKLEVVSILESRARSVDVVTGYLYELLYAFHVKQQNYRKAAAAMLELAWRLGREAKDEDGRAKQVDAYLATINALSIVRAPNAWLVMPLSQGERGGTSPKRSHDGEILPAPVEKKLVVLELWELERELLLARCHLTLSRRLSSQLHGRVRPPDLMPGLLQAGLFDMALALSKAFKLSCTPVFEALALKCVTLQLGGDEARNEAWDWLAANELPPSNSGKDGSSVADEAWTYLQYLLKRERGQEYYRTVMGKVLSHGLPPPTWLLLECKQHNLASLLRLLLSHGRLSTAASLAIKTLEVVTNPSTGGVITGAFPRCLPFSAIDQIAAALSNQPPLEHWKQLHTKLLAALDVYLDKAMRESREMESQAAQRSRFIAA
uniref:nuclear pore complex protein Nup160 isoform X1 n=1 Tax=Myxine glutinosa TaxID=7769 RepID=UPI00358E4909